MSSTALEKPSALPSAEIVEHVLLGGDLSKLTKPQRLSYYHSVCASLGLNPLTRPFDYLRLSGKEVLYAKKDATDQLRKLHGISIERIEQHEHGEVFVVTVYAKDRTGRTDSEIGAVSIAGLKGEARANAMMKSVTKAKRRVTLSIGGLGMLDETEIGADAQPLHFDPQTGEIHDAPATPPPAPSLSEQQALLITNAQRKKLFAVAHEHGWKDADLRTWLAKQGYEHGSTQQIKRADFDRLCAAIAAGDEPEDEGDALDGDELFPAPEESER